MRQEVFFKGIQGKIIEELNNADSSIDIAVAWITNKSILNCLENCAANGVKIRIITVNDHINKIESFHNLYYKGCSIRLMSKTMMHNKFCIIDNYTIISGSFNWTANANNNHENITVTDGDYNLVEKYNTEFYKLYSKSNCIGNLIPLNFDIIKKLERDYELFKYQINTSPPYIYFINEDYFDFNNISNRNGNVLKGYYIIRNIEEESVFLKYIFYSRCGQKFKKVKNAIKIPEGHNLKKINSILGLYHYKEGALNITKKTFVESNDPFSYISELSANYELSNEKKYIVSKFQNSYIVNDNNTIKYINPNIQSKLIFQDNLIHTIKKADLLNENLIFASISIAKMFTKGVIIEQLFNSKPISNMFFDSFTKTALKDIIELSVKPILICDKNGCYSPSDFKFTAVIELLTEKWLLDLKSKKLTKKITENQLNSEYKALYINESKYGILYQIINNYLNSSRKGYLKNDNVKSLEKTIDRDYNFENLTLVKQIEFINRIFENQIKLEIEFDEKYNINKSNNKIVNQEDNSLKFFIIILLCIISLIFSLSL